MSMRDPIEARQLANLIDWLATTEDVEAVDRIREASRAAKSRLQQTILKKACEGPHVDVLVNPGTNLG